MRNYIPRINNNSVRGKLYWPTRVKQITISFWKGILLRKKCITICPCMYTKKTHKLVNSQIGHEDIILLKSMIYVKIAPKVHKMKLLFIGTIFHTVKCISFSTHSKNLSSLDEDSDSDLTIAVLTWVRRSPYASETVQAETDMATKSTEMLVRFTIYPSVVMQ